jgi:hypothetical protein
MSAILVDRRKRIAHIKRMRTEQIEAVRQKLMEALELCEAISAQTAACHTQHALDLVEELEIASNTAPLSARTASTPSSWH